ncbi:MAG: YkgJ family cysteine cluster protein [Candidatus Desulfatibia sp.]|uniref:YkgJ family cysteine cluster protein n=1 Tax=Candidatus Desulfatibia sp. TaxID=3101189 RepID=UPI002F33C173
MKYVDIENLDQLPGRRLAAADKFSFQCHPQIACYNLCCRNLNLFLYPYDVVRLKNRLNLTSDQLLDRYVAIVLRDSNFFPEVLLAMSDTSERTCPFLSDDGCRVYPDRPDTCRTFPVEQGALYDAGGDTTRLVHFFRPPDFCEGQHESKLWTTASWIKDQDAVIYNKMTLHWSRLKRLFQKNPWGREGPEGPKAKMAFMAIYNIDRFRDFLLSSTFLKRYKVKSAILKKIRSDDVELMKFGFQWVRFYVWGLKSKYFRLR